MTELLDDDMLLYHRFPHHVKPIFYALRQGTIDQQR
jgi:hypothetical protein